MWTHNLPSMYDYFHILCACVAMDTVYRVPHISFHQYSTVHIFPRVVSALIASIPAMSHQYHINLDTYVVELWSCM